MRAEFPTRTQATFGLPFYILLLMWPMSSSFFCAAMISLFKVGVRVMLNNDKYGNTWLSVGDPD
jgi:hypothetical protein